MSCDLGDVYTRVRAILVAGVELGHAQRLQGLVVTSATLFNARAWACSTPERVW